MHHCRHWGFYFANRECRKCCVFIVYLNVSLDDADVNHTKTTARCSLALYRSRIAACHYLWVSVKARYKLWLFDWGLISWRESEEEAVWLARSIFVTERKGFAHKLCLLTCFALNRVEWIINMLLVIFVILSLVIALAFAFYWKCLQSSHSTIEVWLMEYCWDGPPVGARIKRSFFCSLDLGGYFFPEMTTMYCLNTSVKEGIQLIFNKFAKKFKNIHFVITNYSLDWILYFIYVILYQTYFILLLMHCTTTSVAKIDQILYICLSVEVCLPW